MSTLERVTRYTRSRRRKPMLNVDLNAAPPCESRSQEGISTCARSRDEQAGQQGDAIPAPIDLEAYEDDVIITSPGAFAEAKNNSRRNHGKTLVIDLDSEERSSRNKRRRISTNQTIINCDVYVNLEESSNGMKNTAQSLVASQPIPPPPKEPKFSCPVCMGPLVEEVSTKCGHIFCKACIKTAIAAQSKCPTCRRKITMKDTFRIYLPATTRA
ncbi:E3 ubiquitin-protein ligase RNF4-like [Olea europaea var. sylvestris]|uniref:E3 ubiquitin-protein ligase RNF4-like n=1 Tax=Olea europaea var. sylvestris TaxID=158386 RepID=UPI000C1D6562|nr:E3 ubiquitin-protein ligase RNF4-like [Olea europaea var. sylvestris]XP_022847207.1 E3 ubiquitin-protein ligase RNF4-like [Olea europaea var. sylvestris]XP_022847208.1 E3 ubiquitin-protein ligase RNF4-like [Olea europaea var. sylvestris]